MKTWKKFLIFSNNKKKEKRQKNIFFDDIQCWRRAEKIKGLWVCDNPRSVVNMNKLNFESLNKTYFSTTPEMAQKRVTRDPINHKRLKCYEIPGNKICWTLLGIFTQVHECSICESWIDLQSFNQWFLHHSPAHIVLSTV